VKSNAMKNAVTQFITFLGARNVSERTRSAYAKTLNEYAEFLQNHVSNWRAVKHSQVLAFLSTFKEKAFAPATMAGKISAIRTFHKFLINENDLPFTNLCQIRRPKISRRIPEYLTLDEISRLLHAVRERTEEGLKNRAMIELMYSSGLRVAEICGLKTSALDFKAGLLRCLGKGLKERMVPIGKRAIKACVQYWTKYRSKKNAKLCNFFVTEKSKPVTGQRVRHFLKFYAERIKLKKRLYPHMLRHTAATHFLQAGANIRLVQEFLGHSSVSTTQIYTHLSNRFIKDSYLKYFPRA